MEGDSGLMREHLPREERRRIRKCLDTEAAQVVVVEVEVVVDIQGELVVVMKEPQEVVGIQ